MTCTIWTALTCLLSILYTGILHAQSDSSANLTTIWNQVEILTPTTVVLPEDFDSTKKYSLIIALHGYGSTAESFLRYSAPFTDAGCIYAVPEAPYRVVFDDGSSGYEWFLYDISSYIMLERPASALEKSAMRLAAEDQMAQVMHDLQSQYNIDKIYFLGFSQGGIVTYLAGIHHHEQIDGIIIFGSVISEDWLGEDTIDQARGLRTMIIQGKKDVPVPIALAEAGRDLLIRHGYDVTYRTFDGGHTVPKDLLDDVIEWMQVE